VAWVAQNITGLTAAGTAPEFSDESESRDSLLRFSFMEWTTNETKV